MTAASVGFLSATRVAAFAVLALSASSRSTQAMCVDVALRFRESRPAPTLVDAMKDEASFIWRAYGVQLEWPAANSVSRCARPRVSFDVWVDRQRTPLPDSRTPVLGSTRLIPSTIGRAPIYIDGGATEQLLGRLSAGRVIQLVSRTHPGPAEVGRALGRVLAHEIGHVVLGAARHQPQGLMRPSFRPEDLISPRRWPYTLSQAEVARLREREFALDGAAGSDDSDRADRDKE
jgi:hypothetical protein